MVNPVTALIVFFILLVILIIIFIPRYGLKPLWIRIRSDKKKILIEDSLKFMYDLYLKKKECTLTDLSKAINLKNAGFVELVQVLFKMNLITLNGDMIMLTSEGINYAIKIVRIHRLLEKYLAEETSVKEDYWHIVAEDREHSISDEEAETLSARLGNPLTDPHGDPIPDKTGGQYQPESRLLSELTPGESGVIVHIEDEPPEKYSKILLLNLHLGSGVKVAAKNKNSFQIESGGKNIPLPSDLADNISISSEVSKEVVKDYRRLTDLKENEEAYVVGISKVIRGQQRRRLLDFGFVPGTKISVRLISLGSDPIAYEVRNTTVALRRQQAEQVFIKDSLEGTEYARN